MHLKHEHFRQRQIQAALNRWDMGSLPVSAQKAQEGPSIPVKLCVKSPMDEVTIHVKSIHIR
jgi:hypothetical protein